MPLANMSPRIANYDPSTDTSRPFKSMSFFKVQLSMPEYLYVEPDVEQAAKRKLL